MKKTLLTTLGCMMMHPLFSQNHVDVLRYSAARFGSTARNLSMGGAFGAIGADASILAVNPAGLGQYRASEFSFGLGAHGTRNSGTYIGNKMDASVFNMSFPNLSYVGTRLLRTESNAKESGWQSYSIGIGLNRVNNFWREMNYEGVNRNSSITHYFAQRAQGIPQSEMDLNSIEGLAYNTYLINPLGQDQYSSAIQDSDINLRQNGRLRSEGNMNEYNLAVGGNYNNKFYAGLGIVIATVRYSSVENFEEKDNGMNDDFRRLEYVTRLNTNGTGIGARIGFILRASELLRFGGSLQTPTLLNLNDEYDYSMRSEFDTASPAVYYYESDLLSYQYKISTPLKATGSVAMIFAKKGLISADLEFLNYSRARLSSLDYAFKDENEAVSKFYKRALNLRFGAEYIYEVFRFRAGFAWYGSPYSPDFSSGGSAAAQKSVCAGIGMRGATYFIDLAYSYSLAEDYYTPYNISNRLSYTATNKLTMNTVLLTAGFRFE